jgi:di/tricarboxylate transporter
MTPEIMLVTAVLLLAVLLFIFEWVRVDVVGWIMIVLLPLLGLVTPEQAISGLSSNAVVSIIGVIIIGAGLDKTGIMHSLARIILRLAGKNENRVMTSISGSVAVISGFMQNIGAAALFLPAARRIASQTGIPAGRLLLPMAYCAIIGGCLTLVGSSPLILLNDLMVIGGERLPPFGLFSVTPLGLLLAIGAIGYFALLGRFILPASRAGIPQGPMSAMLDATYHDVGELFELHLPADCGKTCSLAGLEMRPTYFTSIVAIRRASTGQKLFGPEADTELLPGDHVAVIGPPPFVRDMARDLCWELLPEPDTFAEDLSPENGGIREGLVTPRSKLVGETSRSFGLRHKYHVTPLAIFRKRRVYVDNISEIEFQPGDALLLHGQWKNFNLLRDRADQLVFTEPMKGEDMRREKAPLALLCLAGALTMILVFNVQLSIALLAGALGMVLCRVLTVDEAYRAVDWMTVFLLAGLIPLGLAFENTGAARLIADTLMTGLGTPSPLMLTVAVAVLTSFFTLVTSNVGATVLMVPLSMNMAAAAGVDPRIAALTVAVAASNTFILPTHQVNALVMRPGGFHILDYVRAGAGMTVLYLLIMVGGMTMLYGL